MDPTNKTYYFIEKAELDKLFNILSDFNEICIRLTTANEAFIKVLEQSDKYLSCDSNDTCSVILPKMPSGVEKY